MTKKKQAAAKKEAVREQIYVIVPNTIQVSPGRGADPDLYYGSRGWAVAQSVHVVARMIWENQEYSTADDGSRDAIEDYSKYPVILLGVRNSKELAKVYEDLDGVVQMTEFRDVNKKLYGTTDGVVTTICTSPCYREDVEDVIGHLELY